jgi:hypothetical protein
MPDPNNIENIGNAAILSILGEIKTVLSEINTGVRIGGGAEAGGIGGEASSESHPPNSTITPSGPSSSMFKIASAAASKLSTSLEANRSKQEKEDGISRPPKLPERAAERSAQFFSKAGSNYVPAAKEFVSTVSDAGAKYGKIATQMNQIGEMQGISGSGGDITIPGTSVGFRSPFNDALVAGLKFKAEALKTGMQAGITTGQAEEYGKTTIGMGYNQGTSGFDSIFSGLVDLNKSLGSGFASDPQVQEMLDKSTRYGTNSVKDFTDAMKDLVPAARSAHVNIKQMTSDAAAFGDLARSTGGTYLSGVQTMTAMALSTGLNGATIGRLQSSGLVQANLMRGAQLNPWQLAQATSGQRTDAMYKTIDMLYNQMGPAPKDTYTKDPTTGLMIRHSGQDKRDADVAAMLNISVEDLQKTRRTEATSKSRAVAESGFQAYTQNVAQLATDPKKANALAALATGQTNATQGLINAMHNAGLDQKAIDQVMAAGPHGPNLTASQLVKRANAQKAEFEKLIGQTGAAENTPQGDNVVTIKLSDESRRYLQIDGDPSGETKITVGSGGVRTSSKGPPAYKRTGKTTSGG